MKKIKILNWSPDLNLSNKYFLFIGKSLEIKIFNDILQVYSIKKKSIKKIKLNKTSIFSLNILGSRDFMMKFKYLFDRAKFRL